MKTGYCFETQIGDLFIIEEDSQLIAVTHAIDNDLFVTQELTPFIQSVIQEIRAYLNKETTTLTLPIKLTGTPFTQAIYKTLKSVPYGTTISYKALALKAGYPNSYRAVGNALNKNPLLLYIPCHRVIKHDASLGGFAIDLSIKTKLLNLEGVKL